MTFTVTRLGYSDTASGNNTVFTMPAAQPVGTFLAVIVSSSGGTSTLGLSDTQSNSWTQRKIAANATSPSAVVAIYTTTLTTAMTTSTVLTATSTAGTGCGDIMVIKVTCTTGTVGYVTGGVGTGSSTTPATASFTPGTADLVISGLCASSSTLNSGTTPHAGFTKLTGGDAHTLNRSCVGQYGTPGAATTAGFTMTPSTQWAIAAISLTQVATPSGSLVGEFARFTYNSTTTKTVTVPVTAAVAVGEFAVLAVNCPANTPNTIVTVTDPHSNTWTFREIGVQNNTGSSGQISLITCPITTALTTSDSLTVSVNSNEIQTVTEGGTGLTSFTLTYSGQTTGSITQAASAATVQTALEALSNIGVGDVSVAGSTGGPYTVTFQGALASTNVAQMTATPTGGTGTVTVATLAPGGGVGTTVWAVLGLDFAGVTGYDTGTSNIGASTQNPDSGTTATASQSVELVVAGFAYTGTGVTLNSISGGATGQPVLATSGTVRNMVVAWGFVNSPGTRNITAHMSDNASHAWTGAIIAMTASAPALGTTTWFLWDGTAWQPSEAVLL